MKRMLSALLATVVLISSCLVSLPVSAKENYTEYIVPFYSDQTKQKQVVGISNKSLLKKGVILIPLETACEIAGATIAEENNKAVIITRNYVSWCCEYKDEKNQYLLVDSNTGKGNYYKSALKCLTESSGSGTSFKYSLDDEGIINLPVDSFNKTEIIYEYHDNELYVSFYEFLVMMGVDVDLINHEAINEIIAFYTSMAEEYSDDEDYKTVTSEIDKLFPAGTGYEQFFYCYLGTPIDELYKAYYNSDIMYDLGDYYGDGSVEWANFVNAIENYDGFTKTALAALNLNTDYEDVLINVVTYHGDSEDDNFSKTVDDSVDIIQRLLYVRDFGLSVEEIYRDDSVLEAVWRMQERTDNIEPILSSVDDFDVDFSISPDAISMVYSGLCGAMKNYAKYREMSNLFEGEQYLMKNTILSSDAMASNTTDEARGMFISHILNPMGNVIEMHSNLRNEENSYFNLYHSAAKVQETMNASSPAAWAAVWGAIEEATYSAGDDLIMGVIDYTLFGGMPVSSLVNSGILFCVDGLKNTAYGKEQSDIAELDDYVFIQEVAEDCFKEHSPASENARSSFILGLKSTMLAFKSTNAGSSGEIHGGGGMSFDSDEYDEHKGYVPEGLYELLNKSITANVDFYYVDPGDCGDLTEMLGNNTDISKLDTTPRQEITLEFGDETKEPTKSETIDYEEIYYSYIENELISKYGLSDLVGFEAINWKGSPVVNDIPYSTQGIIGAKIYDYNGDGYEECLVIRQNQYDYIIDCYDHDLNFLDSYTACSFTPGSPSYDVSLKISMLNDYIVIEKSSISVPSLSNYGTNIVILSLSEGKLIETLKFGGFRWATAGETLYMNDESIGITTLTESDAESMKNKIISALQSLGILFNKLEVGWINDSYGVEIEFTDKPMLLFEDVYNDELTYFKDYTNLREHISKQSNTSIDYEEIYYSYIENELIPKYGKANLKPIEINYGKSQNYNDWHGLISEEIYENGNSINLLTTRLTVKNGIPHIILELYSYDSFMRLIDCYEYEMNDYVIEFEISWSEKCILIQYNSTFTHTSGSTDIMIVDLDKNKFNPIFALTTYSSFTHSEEGTYQKLYNPISKKIYYEGTDKKKTTKILDEAFENVKSDLIAVGFTNYEIISNTETGIFTLDILKTNTIYSLSAYNVLLGTVITENDSLNVRQSPSAESTKIGTVDKGETVMIISAINDWYKIEYAGLTGYVLSDFVRLIDYYSINL